jgi:hypothetical protein
VSALERPSEVVLVAFFDAADQAEAAARAFLHSGLGPDRVALLARESRGTAFQAVPFSASLRLPGVGRATVRGALAVELGRTSGAGRGEERFDAALRRLGLSTTDAPCLVRGVRDDLVLVLAAVPREEALGWGRLLRADGAVSLVARPRLERWPGSPETSPAARRLRSVGRAKPSRSASPPRADRSARS